MIYLNASEKKQVTYSNPYAFPPRELTEIEKVIARIIFVQANPATGDEETLAKQEEINLWVDKLKVLTASDRLANKVNAALASEEKFEAFTEGYPYAKYNDIINGRRQLSSLVQLGKDGITEGQIQALMRWVAQVCFVFYETLPKGIDTFIWTPYTKHYKTHAMAKTTGDKAFYGYALPSQDQALINTLFADKVADSRPGGNLWAMQYVRQYEVHKSPEVWTRLGWNDIAKEVFNKGLEMDFGYDYAQGPYWFLELKQESTNTRLRFIVEG